MPLLALLLPLLVGGNLRLFTWSGLDMRDMPGPAGVKMIAELARGHTSRDWCTWLIACAMVLTGDDILAAAWLVMAAGALGCIAAASLAGTILSGWRAGMAAGMLVAWEACCWLVDCFWGNSRGWSVGYPPCRSRG